MDLPILPTSVVGSYSMPSWLERLKTEYSLRKISKADMDEVHDAAVKAAIKDQEMAGLDIVTDGEMRRDNMIDYFAERLPGVEIDHTSKQFYYDYFDSVVRGKLPLAAMGLVDDLKFLQANTDRTVKFCVTGPHSLVKRIKNEYYPGEEEFAVDIARVMNLELKELVRAGARWIQVDEPYYSGFPQDLPWGVQALNALVDGVEARIVLHICYGNRYGKPSWAGNYRYLFPTILNANVSELTLSSRGAAARIWRCSRSFPTSSTWASAPSTSRATTSKLPTSWPSAFGTRWSSFPPSASSSCPTADAITWRSRSPSASSVLWLKAPGSSASR